eukprot:s1226_g37.t1
MKLAIPGVAVAVVLHGLVLVHATSAAPQLPKVPKVFNAGPDGMPQLPNVERLLTDYQEVKQQLDSEASDLAQHVQQVEASGIKLLAQQKEVYDKKLQDQEKENLALVRNNAHLAKEIITARQQNTKMKKDLVHKEKLMSFRQNQLRGLEQELDRSQKFFQQVVDATNFVEEGTLTPAPTEDVDETELLEKDAVSFLEVSKKRKHRGKTSLRQPLLTEESALMLEAVRQSANGTEIKDSGDASDAEKDGQIITLLTEDLQKLHQAELRGTAKTGVRSECRAEADASCRRNAEGEVSQSPRCFGPDAAQPEDGWRPLRTPAEGGSSSSEGSATAAEGGFLGGWQRLVPSLVQSVLGSKLGKKRMLQRAQPRQQKAIHSYCTQGDREDFGRGKGKSAKGGKAPMPIPPPLDRPEEGRGTYGTGLALVAHLVADKLTEMANEKERSASLLRLAEEDLVQFMVKLSVEGFPQAVKVRRMQKYSGTILRSPEWNRDSPEDPWKPGLAVCQEIGHYGGSSEVLIRQDACGQICFQSGDKVTFCIPQAAEPGALPEAKLVMLAHTDRPAGSVLACCRIHLPRPGAGEGKPQPAPLSLDLHAFASKVVLSGLSIDVGEAELMRFFSKQGATKGIVAHARGCSFASITFPSAADIATFLGRDAHAFADDKETRIALLLNRVPMNSHSCSEQARLPALPAPSLRPGEEPSAVIINWTPLQLAIGYVVEMRPAGSKADWSPVDVGGPVEPGYFSQSCSSCKVSGLRSGFAYEARVTYISSCSCRSEASDASASCAPCGEYRIPRDPSFPQVPVAPVAPVAPAPAGRAKMGQNQNQSYPGLSTPTWRCVHGAVVPPPSVPEVLAGDEAGFSVAVRWPSVGHAAAYVIEFKEAGSTQTERFVRAAAPTTPGTLVELRVGGLRPVPGRSYIAQVRCVAQCGCESAPSSPAYSPTIGSPEGSPGGLIPTWNNPDQQATSGSVQMPSGFAFSGHWQVALDTVLVFIGLVFSTMHWFGLFESFTSLPGSGIPEPGTVLGIPRTVCLLSLPPELKSSLAIFALD